MTGFILLYTLPLRNYDEIVAGATLPIFVLQIAYKLVLLMIITISSGT